VALLPAGSTADRPSTGQPATLGENAAPSTVERRHPKPATIRPAGPVGDEMRERIEHLDRRSAPHRERSAGPTVGRRKRPGASASSSPVGTNGFAERQIQVHRSRPVTRSRRRPAARRQRAATSRPAPSRSLGHLGFVEPADRIAEQLHLVERSGRRRLSRSSGRSVGGAQRSTGRARWCASRTAGVEVGAGGARRAQQHWGATGGAREAEREERRRALVEVHVQSDAVVARQRERERPPSGSRAARQASVTPWRAHSSTNVAGEGGGSITSHEAAGHAEDASVVADFRLRARLHPGWFVVGCRCRSWCPGP